MDTTAITMRLHKLDSYLRTLRQMQAVPQSEYLSDDNIQTIVERKLQRDHRPFPAQRPFVCVERKRAVA